MILSKQQYTRIKANAVITHNLLKTEINRSKWRILNKHFNWGSEAAEINPGRSIISVHYLFRNIGRGRNASHLAPPAQIFRFSESLTRRALLTNRAPASGNDAKALYWIRVTDTCRGYPPGDQSLHSFPGQQVFMVAAA
jgi:hypothetical protein